MTAGLRHGIETALEVLLSAPSKTPELTCISRGGQRPVHQDLLLE